MNNKNNYELFITTTTDPYFNIALEEWFLKKYKSNNQIIFLWQNFNSIIIGRNQNTHLEINQKLVEKYKVKVARRLSGGGAVFQDKYNQCWTFIAKNNKGGDYRFFATPILQFLKTIGVNAEFLGRNDLTINNKKISGTAQFVYGDYVLCHGTLLFDVDLQLMTSILTPNLEKLSSKGVDSIRKRVLNLKEVLPNLDFLDFQTKFIEFLEKYFNAKFQAIPEEATKYATLLAKDKYSTWDWNYGESKNFEFIKKQYFPGKGSISICFNTNKNIIEDLKIYGDFLSTKNIEGFALLFSGCKYDKNSISDLLQNFDLEEYLGEISKDDFISCIFN